MFAFPFSNRQYCSYSLSIPSFVFRLILLFSSPAPPLCFFSFFSFFLFDYFSGVSACSPPRYPLFCFVSAW
ncbi:hypothetical protein TRSC58_07396 [Trypanosoma rangeli SC58]|uniref:Uncharacterized protein n=1 Tax=Trypanosoma rangeli SC58 TaxID=429131 RepID=A0A061IRM6_TRYRA|nr:hypothetical protein TRSC58_07396 [Trypanosoma rangeli SC58]